MDAKGNLVWNSEIPRVLSPFFPHCLISTRFSYFCIFGWMRFFFNVTFKWSHQNLTLMTAFCRIVSWSQSSCRVYTRWLRLHFTLRRKKKKMSDRRRDGVMETVLSDLCMVFKFLFLYDCSRSLFRTECQQLARHNGQTEKISTESYYKLFLYGLSVDIYCKSTWKPASYSLH